MAGVYHVPPNVLPSQPDLPCYVLEEQDPFLVTASEFNSSVGNTWNFNLVFLYKAGGLGTAEENRAGAEAFYQLTINALYAHFALSTSNVLMNKDTGTLTFTPVTLLTQKDAPEGSTYWGFQCALSITEIVTVTMGT